MTGHRSDCSYLDCRCGRIATSARMRQYRRPQYNVLNALMLMVGFYAVVAFAIVVIRFAILKGF